MHVASGDLWAGAEVQLYTLAKTLHSQTDAIVSVVLFNHGTLEHKLRVAGIHVVVIDESALNGIQILLRLVRNIREQRPDVIHTHRIKENILGSIAAILCCNIPSLRTVHGAPEHNPAWWQFHKRLIIANSKVLGLRGSSWLQCEGPKKSQHHSNSHARPFLIALHIALHDLFVSQKWRHSSL